MDTTYHQDDKVLTNFIYFFGFKTALSAQYARLCHVVFLLLAYNVQITYPINISII